MGDATSEAPEKRPVIYVTGFGPFQSHPVNPSQVVVELLHKTDLEEELGVRLVTETIQVEYHHVQDTINRRWKELDPKLVVHLGVSGVTQTLTLEQLAHNKDYVRPDVCGRLPSQSCCCPEGEEVVQSGLRMDLISSTLNKMTNLKLPCAKSTDPGRFLCDFIYYMSLSKDRTRSAFIHIPPFNTSAAPDTVAAVVAAIKEMYRQVMEKDAGLKEHQQQREELDEQLVLEKVASLALAN